MSEIVTVDDEVTKVEIEALEDEVRAYDKKISKLNHIKRCLQLTVLYDKSTTSTTDGIVTTTTEKLKHIDPQTGEIMTDDKRLEINTLWMAKGRTARGVV